MVISLNFNLNNKDSITITLKIELHYTSPIVWMCLTLGLFFMIVIGYYVLKYVKENYHERKKNREVSQHSLIMSFEEEEEVYECDDAWDDWYDEN